ncbi:MAG: T9SS type A sorting domain-containing protein [Bacteroidia bacterium]|nr:T9SS type A sorting domain-containing protein [Bacteroidia bacterium]
MLLVSYLLLAFPSLGQISFPNGNILNLVTTKNQLYLETKVLFKTGIYKADDYCWTKISDSLDTRWQVTSCFNGDCRTELIPAGCFLKEFGENDTSCFIAFHVEAYSYKGKSVIKYHVYNKKNNSDSADLIFNISYAGTTGTEDIYGVNEVVVYPNPFTTDLRIQVNKLLPEGKIVVTDVFGKTVLEQSGINRTNNPVDVTGWSSGVYFLQVVSGGKCEKYKIIKQ